MSPNRKHWLQYEERKAHDAKVQSTSSPHPLASSVLTASKSRTVLGDPPNTEFVANLRGCRVGLVVGNGLSIDLRQSVQAALANWDTQSPLGWKVATPNAPTTALLSETSLPHLFRGTRSRGGKGAVKG